MSIEKPMFYDEPFDGDMSNLYKVTTALDRALIEADGIVGPSIESTPVEVEPVVSQKPESTHTHSVFADRHTVQFEDFLSRNGLPLDADDETISEFISAYGIYSIQPPETLAAMGLPERSSWSYVKRSTY